MKSSFSQTRRRVRDCRAWIHDYTSANVEEGIDLAEVIISLGSCIRVNATGDQKYNLDKWPCRDTYSSAGLYFSDAPPRKSTNYRATYMCAHVQMYIGFLVTFRFDAETFPTSKVVRLLRNLCQQFFQYVLPRFTQFLRRDVACLLCAIT